MTDAKEAEAREPLKGSQKFPRSLIKLVGPIEIAKYR